MRITSEVDQRHLINWNQSTLKTCRRKQEWQETFFTSVVRTMGNSMSTKKLFGKNIFHGVSDCVNVHFVEVKRVCLGKERCWIDLTQDYPQFRGRKEAIHSTYGNQMETQSEH